MDWKTWAAGLGAAGAGYWLSRVTPEGGFQVLRFWGTTPQQAIAELKQDTAKRDLIGGMGVTVGVASYLIAKNPYVHALGAGLTIGTALGWVAGTADNRAELDTQTQRLLQAAQPPPPQYAPGPYPPPQGS